ncbi:50S ribosomal protein L3 [bacterium]|nr:50S ribosomal protein L3 [bacterium]NIN92277.1 50S ribosomal protein L3 [bacterium]NIO18399.1 50S ribosomal protein L3 [bacterium]NIO73392.1 50S ribosomal protein L3 [bacterium]
MMVGILGEKVGMSQVFSEKGKALPVTVIKAGPCFVVQKKSDSREGYNAIQLGYGEIKEKSLNKPEKGHFEKAKVGSLKYLREFRVENVDEYQLGQEIKVDLFKVGDYVDVKGTSKGKGFAGGVKRWGFRGGPASHGSSHHRRVGSIGASSFPSRVLPGTKMAGRMGGNSSVAKKLEVVKIIPEENLILVKGAIPGVKKGLVVISRSKKQEIREIQEKQELPEKKEKEKKEEKQKKQETQEKQETKKKQEKKEPQQTQEKQKKEEKQS